MKQFISILKMKTISMNVIESETPGKKLLIRIKNLAKFYISTAFSILIYQGSKSEMEIITNKMLWQSQAILVAHSCHRP